MSQQPLPAATVVAGRWFVAVRLPSGVELVLRGPEREAVEAELRRLTDTATTVTVPKRRSDP